MKKGLTYLIIFIILILVYIASLIITSLIPSSLIKEQVTKTSETLIKETNVGLIDLKVKNIYLDNYTVALMINNAYSMDNKDPLSSSLLVRKNYLPGITQIVYEDTSKELVSASKYEKLDGVGELKDTVNGAITESFEYARYWHGYLIILKPLLLFFNIEQIRIISTVLIITLSIYLLWIIYKKIDKKTAILFLGAILFCEIFVLGWELQGQLNIYIALIFSIVLLRNNKTGKKKNIYKLFFAIGSITNFFDFLTIPIITYAIPLMLYFKMESKEHKRTIKEIVELILKSGIAWVIGYALTWVVKWIIVDCIYDRNIIIKSIMQAQYRGLDLKFGYIQTIVNNLMGLGIIPMAVLIYLIAFNIFMISINVIKKINNINNVFYIIVSLIPFVWYFVVREHSYQHAIFTYRTLYITIIANILMISENLLSKNETKTTTSIDKKQ